jgi:hypothetical protein
MKRYYIRQTSLFALSVPPALLLDYSAGRIFKKSAGRIRSSPVDIIPPWFSMLMYQLGDEQLAS